MQAMPSKNTSFLSTIFRANANTASIPPSVPLSRLTDNVLDGTSSVHIEELQKAWEVGPDSVDESWDNFFRNFGGQTATSTGVTGQTRQESMRLLLLIKAYQVYGHMNAKLDPPGLEEREIPDNMDPAFHGSTETDLDREFFIELWNTPGFLADTRPMMTLRSILTRLEQAYCGSIGYEYMHINDKEKCNWLREKCIGYEYMHIDAEIVWCQEEPMNMGASSYIAPRLCTAMKATGRGSWEDIKYVGRGPSASTATGFARVHKSEQAEIVQFAMKPQPVKIVC